VSGARPQLPGAARASGPAATAPPANASPANAAAATEIPASAPSAAVPQPGGAPGRVGHPHAARDASHPHLPHFQFLLGALGALGACAIAAFVLLLAPSHSSSAPEAPWSAWKPLENGVDPATQIAAHVAPEYRLDNGRQLAEAKGGPPSLNGQPLTVGMWRSGQQPARLEGNSVLYWLCGGGAECSIKEGKPSKERALLLGREALELALYTFHYIGGVDEVIVTMPPPPPGTKAAGGKGAAATGTKTTGAKATGASATSTAKTFATGPGAQPKHAFVLRPQDLATQLGEPLDASLSPATPRVSQMNGSADAPLVVQLTNPRLYDYVIDEANASGPIMLLQPPGLGG
jgi:hypothetical protein